MFVLYLICHLVLLALILAIRLSLTGELFAWMLLRCLGVLLFEVLGMVDVFDAELSRIVRFRVPSIKVGRRSG